MTKSKPIIDLTTTPITKLLFQLAIPAATGSLFNILYSIVDTLYASKLGTSALAGLSLTFPVFFIFIALGFGFAGGATVLIGQALGQKDRDEASRITWQLLSFGLVMSIILTFVGYFGNRYVFIFLGAEGEYLDIANSYMNVLFLASPLVLLPGLINAGLVAQGITKIYRNAVVVAFFANLVLNPLFIYGAFGIPKMGVVGIALATVISQTGTVVYLIYQLSKTGLLGGFSLSKLIPDKAKWLDLWQQGIPAVLNMFSVAIFFFICNRYVVTFGQEGVAAYGIGLRIEQLILVPTMAFNQAALTLVATNFGAGKFERVFQTWRSSLKITFIWLGLGTVVLLFAARTMLGFFTDDPLVVKFGMEYLTIEAFTLAAYSLLHCNSGVLQGLKKPKMIMWVGITRMVVIPILLLPLMIDWMGWGLSSIWWMILVSSWGSGIFLFFYTRLTLKKRIAEGMASMSAKI